MSEVMNLNRNLNDKIDEGVNQLLDCTKSIEIANRRTDEIEEEQTPFYEISDNLMKISSIACSLKISIEIYNALSSLSRISD